MKKLKLALAVVSVLILVVPVAALVLAYSDNLMDVLIPSDMKGAFNSGLSRQSQLYPQVLAGAFNSADKTVSFQLNITNPLNTHLKVNAVTAKVVVFDDNKELGNITLSFPITIEAGKSAVLQVSGPLNSGIEQYFANYASGGYQNIHLAFQDLTIEAGGLQIRVDRQDAGSIPLGGMA
jgi:beta-mannanase